VRKLEVFTSITFQAFVATAFAVRLSVEWRLTPVSADSITVSPGIITNVRASTVHTISTAVNIVATIAAGAAINLRPPLIRLTTVKGFAVAVDPVGYASEKIASI
jgi:hypothetical protein